MSMGDRDGICRAIAERNGIITGKVKRDGK